MLVATACLVAAAMVINKDKLWLLVDAVMIVVCLYTGVALIREKE